MLYKTLTLSPRFNSSSRHIPLADVIFFAFFAVPYIVACMLYRIRRAHASAMQCAQFIFGWEQSKECGSTRDITLSVLYHRDYIQSCTSNTLQGNGRVGRALIVVQRTGGVRAAALGNGSVDRHPLAVLRATIAVEVVPDLAHVCVASVGAVSGTAGSGGIVSGTGAANVWCCAIALGKSSLHIAEGVGGGVGGTDTGGREPAVGWQAAVVEDGGLEEVDEIIVLRGDIGAIAGRIEGAEAGCVLGEFVGPEFPVGLTLGDPEPAMR